MSPSLGVGWEAQAGCLQLSTLCWASEAAQAGSQLAGMYMQACWQTNPRHPFLEPQAIPAPPQKVGALSHLSAQGLRDLPCSPASFSLRSTSSYTSMASSSKSRLLSWRHRAGHRLCQVSWPWHSALTGPAHRDVIGWGKLLVSLVPPSPHSPRTGEWGRGLSARLQWE